MAPLIRDGKVVINQAGDKVLDCDSCPPCNDLCTIYKDTFNADNLTTDYNVVHGTFRVYGGILSNTLPDESVYFGRILVNELADQPEGHFSITFKVGSIGEVLRFLIAYKYKNYPFYTPLDDTYYTVELTFASSECTWLDLYYHNRVHGIVYVTNRRFFGPLQLNTFYTIDICWGVGQIFSQAIEYVRAIIKYVKDNQLRKVVLGQNFDPITSASFYSDERPAFGNGVGLEVFTNNSEVQFDDLTFTRVGHPTLYPHCPSCFFYGECIYFIDGFDASTIGCEWRLVSGSFTADGANSRAILNGHIESQVDFITEEDGIAINVDIPSTGDYIIIRPTIQTLSLSIEKQSNGCNHIILTYGTNQSPIFVGPNPVYVGLVFHNGSTYLTIVNEFDDVSDFSYKVPNIPSFSVNSQQRWQLVSSGPVRILAWSQEVGRTNLDNCRKFFESCFLGQDSFNRTDLGDCLWKQVTGTWDISGNELRCTTSSGLIRWNNPHEAQGIILNLLKPWHYVSIVTEITTATAGTKYGCVVDYEDENNYHYGEVEKVLAPIHAKLNIYKVSGGTATLLATTNIGSPLGNKLTVCSSPENIITVILAPFFGDDSTQTLSIETTYHNGGFTGIILSGASNITVDDFIALKHNDDSNDCASCTEIPTCDSTICSSGDAPQFFKVTLSGISDDICSCISPSTGNVVENAVATDCDLYNSTYILERESPARCCYTTPSQPWRHSCSGFSGWFYLVLCLSNSGGSIRLELTLTFGHTCPGFNPTDTDDVLKQITWTRTLPGPPGPTNCTTINTTLVFDSESSPDSMCSGLGTSPAVVAL